MFKRDHCISANDASIIPNTVICIIAGITTNICIGSNLPAMKKSSSIHCWNSSGVASLGSSLRINNSPCLSDVKSYTDCLGRPQESLLVVLLLKCRCHSKNAYYKNTHQGQSFQLVLYFIKSFMTHELFPIE